MRGTTSNGIFLSTPSARRATVAVGLYTLVVEISIHALREEGDRYFRAVFLRLSTISIHALREEGDDREGRLNALAADFYPRPPRGGRRSFFFASTASCRFLSTPSARRATDHPGLFSRGVDISIHALREEGDPAARVRVAGVHRISIHALREEGDAEKVSS